MTGSDESTDPTAADRLSVVRAEAEALYRQSFDSYSWEEWVEHADRIAELRRDEPFAADPELARLEAQVFVEALDEIGDPWAYEGSAWHPGAWRMAVDRVAALRRSDPALDTVDLASIEARLLAQAGGVLWDEGPEVPADRIAAIRAGVSESQRPVFLLLEAQALVAAGRGLAQSTEEPERSIQPLVDRIARLRQGRLATEIAALAAAQARAMAYALMPGSALTIHELEAGCLRELREQDVSLQLVEVAVEEAQALLRACWACEPDDDAGMQPAVDFADRIAALRESREAFQVLELAIAEGEAIRLACRVVTDTFEVEALSLRIAGLREIGPSFQSPALAELEAGAIVRASALTEDHRRTLALADRIAELRAIGPEFQTEELARLEAQAVLNASVDLVGTPGASLADARALAARISTLRNGDPTFQTARIALSEAYALFNCSHHTEDPAERAGLAARIRELRQGDDAFGTPQLALREAQAWLNACNRAPDAERALSLARRITELRTSDPRFETHEIAMREARALVTASFKAETTDEALAMANHVAGMRAAHEQYATHELALQQAKILTNASRHVEEPGPALELADRIAALRSSTPDFDTPEFAVQEAGALNNAASEARTVEECEPIFERIAALRDRGPGFDDSDRLAFRQARAYYNASRLTSDPDVSLDLANRIEALRESKHEFHTPEIALREAKALGNASIDSDDPEASARFADRIAALRASDLSLDTVELALEEAEILLRALELGVWSDHAAALHERTTALVTRCEDEAPPELEGQVRGLSMRAARFGGRS